MLKMKDLRDVDLNPVRIGNREFDVSVAAQQIQERADKMGVPLKVSTDKVVAGGLFSKVEYPCILLEHPNPPQSYFYYIMVVGNGTIVFKYFGFSDATYNHNRKKAYAAEGTLTGMIKGAFVKDDEMALQEELTWRGEMFGVVKSFFG